jgi:hypothetical protein
MIYLHDVDILLKLAACGLLESLPELLEADDSDLLILDTAKFKIRALGRQKKYPLEVVERALRFCESHAPLPELRDTKFVEDFKSLGVGMDPGEVVLFAVAQEISASTVVTSDKRALKVLGSLGKNHPIRQSLRGRILCFEAILLRYEERCGYESLREACCRGMEADGMLRLAFSSGLATVREHAMECLYSHLREVQSSSGELLEISGVLPKSSS